MLDGSQRHDTERKKPIPQIICWMIQFVERSQNYITPEVENSYVVTRGRGECVYVRVRGQGKGDLWDTDSILTVVVVTWNDTCAKSDTHMSSHTRIVPMSSSWPWCVILRYNYIRQNRGDKECWEMVHGISVIFATFYESIISEQKKKQKRPPRTWDGNTQLVSQISEQSLFKK